MFQPSMPYPMRLSSQPGVCSDQTKPDLMETKEKPCRLEGGAQADTTSKSVEEVPVLVAPYCSGL